MFMAQRRRKNSAASAMPNSSASSQQRDEPGAVADAIGPSTTAAVTRGTASWASVASRAAENVSAMSRR